MPANYFELFSLPPQFNLDLQALEKQYFTLQRQHHPDRTVGGTPEERQQAAQITAAINDAYQALRSPMKRAQYLLSLNNIRVNTDSDTLRPAPSTLAEIMELQEEQENCTTAAEIGTLAETVKQRETNCMQALQESFAANEYDHAAQHAIRLKYLNKLTEDIRVRQLRQERVG